MNIEIKYVKDKNSANERAVFVVKKNCDIGNYLVFLTQKIGTDTFSAEVKYPFWFPNKEVKENDLLILYTKAGNTSQKVNSDSTTSYFFYRGQNEFIFTDPDRIVLLLEADNWVTE